MSVKAEAISPMAPAAWAAWETVCETMRAASVDWSWVTAAAWAMLSVVRASSSTALEMATLSPERRWALPLPHASRQLRSPSSRAASATPVARAEGRRMPASASSPAAAAVIVIGSSL